MRTYFGEKFTWRPCFSLNQECPSPSYVTTVILKSVFVQAMWYFKKPNVVNLLLCTCSPFQSLMLEAQKVSTLWQIGACRKRSSGCTKRGHYHYDTIQDKVYSSVPPNWKNEVSPNSKTPKGFQVVWICFLVTFKFNRCKRKSPETLNNQNKWFIM